MKGKTVWLSILVLGFLWLAPVAAQAADGAEPPVSAPDRATLDELRHEIVSMRQQLLQLEERISAMERRSPDSPASRQHTDAAPAGRNVPENGPAVQEPVGAPSGAAVEAQTARESGGGTPSSNTTVASEPVEPPSAAAADIQTSVANSSSGSPSFRQQWRSIERRMSAEQIEALLGAPQQKFTVAGKTVWYYLYPDNKRGSVTFAEDMRVSGWQKPPFGGF
jgi:hypothetical protein